MKRLFDILVSSSLLISSSPFLFIIALIIYFSDPGPIFYKQKRVGLNGKSFKILKFRSMKVDSDKIGPYFTLDNDPRITKIGKFLRRTSIDELPQLLNVFFNDMSIVGPRPNVPQQESLYTPENWKKRNSVQPGITGFAQATLRSNATEDQRSKMDLYYVDHFSLLFDMKIIFMTIIQIIKKGGN
ncbi:sugar transferase [Xenorhabdus bovienii]|uniref:sugar transferase n=1 Tax=Xenorhabdus bovienii TaxID=40576 RepID=UPI0023B34EFB|nr:sugar transferase [Xenorhabdus bovienii]MDE9493188.1 sugar transferase [Xenorhabdus bovienii]MDE9501724.1 sugar transferase [Xenorhabdus bovienii]MDE9525508.1 sugar transferase [Xenorhabdus bovienii]MDE9568055.1 sugar transferase [Xenorhabdus bovienii]